VPGVLCGYCGAVVDMPGARLVAVRGVSAYVCGHHPPAKGEVDAGPVGGAAAAEWGSVIAWLVSLPWERGECFKCEAANVPVTRYGAMAGTRGTVGLFTCEPCTYRMEYRYLSILDGTHVPALRPLRAVPPTFLGDDSGGAQGGVMADAWQA